jgi:hypothetical protein
VRGLQSFGNLYGDIQRLVELQRPRLNLFFQALAFDEFHRDEGLPLDLVNLVNGANVGMIQRPDLPYILV